jgi:hypothetical protein
MDTIVLDRGALNWHPDERRIDRYGTVHLNSTPDGRAFTPVLFDAAPVGTRGRRVAVIVATRSSFHLGDHVRGVGPNPATVGAEISLGAGKLFVQESEFGHAEIGLRPDDGRDEAWLDPAALYRCHGQVVRLELRCEGTQVVEIDDNPHHVPDYDVIVTDGGEG